MKASELFGVGVRLIGLLIIIYGLYELWSGLENMAENLLPDVEQVSVISYFAFGIPSLIFGTMIFFAADLIVKVGYRNENK